MMPGLKGLIGKHAFSFNSEQIRASEFSKSSYSGMLRHPCRFVTPELEIIPDRKRLFTETNTQLVKVR